MKQGVEAFEEVTKLKQTIAEVKEDNSMLRQIIDEAKKRISEIQEENQSLTQKMESYKKQQPENWATPGTKDEDDSFPIIDYMQSSADQFSLDSFSFRETPGKPPKSKINIGNGSTGDFLFQMPSQRSSDQKSTPSERNSNEPLFDSFVIKSDYMDEQILSDKKTESTKNLRQTFKFYSLNTSLISA